MSKLVILALFLLASCSLFGQVVDTAGRKAIEQALVDSVKSDRKDTTRTESRRERKQREKAEEEAKEPVIFKDSTRLAVEAQNRRAWRRSMILPGWGQYTNGGWWWLKVPVLYGGLTSTVLAFDFYNRYYRELLTELNYRYDGYGSYYPAYQNANEQSLINAKDYARRNRDMMVLLTVGVYGLNIVEAYVDSMLKYRWNIGDDAENNMNFSVLPTVMNGSYAGNGPALRPVMGLKIRMQLN